MKRAFNFILLAMIFLSVGYGLGRYQRMNVVETDTIARIDTIRDTLIFRDTVPFINKVEIIKRDTFYTKDNEEIELKTERKTYIDTLVCEEDTAVATVYVRGINVYMDSLRLELKKKEIIKEIEVIKYLEKKKDWKDRFHIVPNISAGYGFINRRFDIYAGVGVAYQF